MKRQRPRKLQQDRAGISPVVAVIILVGITVVLAGVLYIWVSNTMQAGGLGKETAPTVIYSTTNANDALSDDDNDERVATITLTEGSVLLSHLSHPYSFFSIFFLPLPNPFIDAITKPRQLQYTPLIIGQWHG